ncbi:MAG: glucose-1-phosphate adenylyltransferase subunit GlgD [Lachnospiraceae bacterium]|nr:glucose-1-phosphate adenylyltransferase subunit GlgD [Lachnospiraceae bacterium]
MAKAFGIVTAASNRFYVEGLQDYRPIAAFSVFGRYRLIDFPISSMSNSNIDRIFVFINGNPRSLVRHLGSGRLYNINAKRGRLELLFHEEGTTNQIYHTDVAAFLDNLEHLERATEEYVVIAPSNVLYTQNYDKLLNQHIESGADVTLLYQKVDNADTAFLGCQALTLNRQKGVETIASNMGNEKSKNIFLDTYVMKKSLFLDLIHRAKELSSVYQLSRMLSTVTGELDIRGVQHKGYAAAITDFKSFYDANLSLIDQQASESLFDPAWPIYTRTTDSCPSQLFEGASVKNSLISNGCTIEGTVENSVIGRGVKIGKGAVVRNCVLLAYSSVADGVHVENEVIDKWASIIHADEVVSDAAHPGYIRRSDTL